MDSTLYPGQTRAGYKVHFATDDTEEHLEEEELRPLIYTGDMEERAQIVQGLIPAFKYLESRITGTCETNFSCEHMYEASHRLVIPRRTPTPH